MKSGVVDEAKVRVYLDTHTHTPMPMLTPRFDRLFEQAKLELAH